MTRHAHLGGRMGFRKKGLTGVQPSYLAKATKAWGFDRPSERQSGGSKKKRATLEMVGCVRTTWRGGVHNIGREHFVLIPERGTCGLKEWNRGPPRGWRAT